MWFIGTCLWPVLIINVSGVLNTAQSASLRCYHRSLEESVVIPLKQPQLLAITPCINPELPTVIYTFGYRGRVAGPATTAVISAYLAKKKANVVLLDWEQEARSGLLGITLGYVINAVPNAKKVGNQLGDSLVILARSGLNITHLVGHSLGAHIMGYAGRRARAQGYTVPRITGLDPARALFEGTLATQSKLDRTCALFVDIIHSDPGGYGTDSSSGTVDFWPNYSGSGTGQPGCPTGDFEMFSAGDLCSHDRSWRYYVESISSQRSFPAASPTEYSSLISRDSMPQDVTFMGEITNIRARGNYFLTTSSRPPFGKGTDGLHTGNNFLRRRRRRNSLLSKLLQFF